MFRLGEMLKTWLGWAGEGDYFAILAYVPPSAENDLELAELQRRVRDLTGIATTAAYGPRYLHSTGQLHKGGPNTGVFLQIVPSPRTDFLVPGEDVSLGRVIGAQADGRATAKGGQNVVTASVADPKTQNRGAKDRRKNTEPGKNPVTSATHVTP